MYHNYIVRQTHTALSVTLLTYLLLLKFDYYVGTSLLCFYFNLLCYAAVLIIFTYYGQYCAHVSDLCLGINHC